MNRQGVHNDALDFDRPVVVMVVVVTAEVVMVSQHNWL